MYFVLILEAEDDVIVGLLNTSDAALSLIGLQDGRQYRARVRGVSQMGAEGPWSEFVFFTVPQPPNTGTAQTSPHTAHHHPFPHSLLPSPFPSPHSLLLSLTPLLTLPLPTAGAVGGDVDKVEAIVIGATLGVLLCVVAVAMGIGMVAVFYRLKHRDSEWSHDITRRSHDITCRSHGITCRSHDITHQVTWCSFLHAAHSLRPSDRRLSTSTLPDAVVSN